MAELPNFSYIWKNLVAGAAHPGAGTELAGNLSQLRQLGIHGILSLTEHPLDKVLIREFEMDYLHLPIDDFTAPDQRQARQAVSFLTSLTEQGQGVLVHCRAGLGRTGTILACFLVAQGLNPAQAIQQVRRLRPGSLEVYSQEYCVYEFARQTNPNELAGGVE